MRKPQAQFRTTFNACRPEIENSVQAWLPANLVIDGGPRYPGGKSEPNVPGSYFVPGYPGTPGTRRQARNADTLKQRVQDLKPDFQTGGLSDSFQRTTA
eukprot:476573-Rhodomonas_salina.4